MIYALDTNIISYLLRRNYNTEVAKRFETEIDRGNHYVIPPLSYYEITWYLIRKNAAAQLRIFQELYRNAYTKIGMNETDFITAAKIKAYLEERGTPISKNDADIFIAAYCITNGYTLVTDNIKHFEHIDGLELVNWKEYRHAKNNFCS